MGVDCLYLLTGNQPLVVTPRCSIGSIKFPCLMKEVCRLRNQVFPVQGGGSPLTHGGGGVLKHLCYSGSEETNWGFCLSFTSPVLRRPPSYTSLVICYCL